MSITYNDLFAQIVEQIEKYSAYPTDADPWKGQQSLTNVAAPVLFSGAVSSASTGGIYDALANLLVGINPSRIKSGLTVEATDPNTNKVIVRAGEGSAGSKMFSLTKDVTIDVPFDSNTEVFYVNLFENGVRIERNTYLNRVLLAKIIIPKPNITNIVKDNALEGDSWDAYIINLKEYILHGDAYGNLEEDSIELLRNNIGDILADNLIGNIRLSENLKVINTAGSIELDSNALKVKDENENILSKFNKDGIFIYDATGIEMARFTGTEASIGNISIVKNAIQSKNFVSGSIGFQLLDDGNVEFNDLTVRGTIYATAGEIGGFTIESDKLYGGTIQTGENVSEGQNGVKLDSTGLSVYDDVLGRVAYFPSDGSAPSISSGTITEVTYEISTNSVLRTSETVGDGSSASWGILINNTGLYGCEANQTLGNANLKALIDGTVRLEGTIYATSGEIGSVTITPTKLSGGLIEGSTIRGSIFENSATLPKIVLDSTGIHYQATTNIGKYGVSGSGGVGFQYGDGTLYGTGLRASLLGTNLPPIAILAEDTYADIRTYNRLSTPSSGDHVLGDILCIDGYINYCVFANSPGTFVPIGGIVENRSNDNGCTQTGRIWFRTDV